VEVVSWKFLENYEILQTCLGALEEKLVDATSQCHLLQEQVYLFNIQLQKTLEKSQKIGFNYDVWIHEKEEAEK